MPRHTVQTTPAPVANLRLSKMSAFFSITHTLQSLSLVTYVLGFIFGLLVVIPLMRDRTLRSNLDLGLLFSMSASLGWCVVYIINLPLALALFDGYIVPDTDVYCNAVGAASGLTSIFTVYGMLIIALERFSHVLLGGPLQRRTVMLIVVLGVLLNISCVTIQLANGKMAPTESRTWCFYDFAGEYSQGSVQRAAVWAFLLSLGFAAVMTASSYTLIVVYSRRVKAARGSLQANESSNAPETAVSGATQGFDDMQQRLLVRCVSIYSVHSSHWTPILLYFWYKLIAKGSVNAYLEYAGAYLSMLHLFTTPAMVVYYNPAYRKTIGAFYGLKSPFWT